MLRLIIGGAKTGKSTQIRQELLSLAEENPSGGLFLFVPEQFSYETERDYFEALGVRRADRVKVFSFGRLAGELFREFGGLARTYASDTAKLLTMKLALQDCRHLLRLYAPLAGKPDFPAEMVRAMGELKYAGISAEALEAAAAQAEDGYLKDKLLDLSTIRASFDALLSEHYADSLDDLTRALALVTQHQWFAGKAIWLDGFKSFTGVQEQLLAQMLAQGAEVTAAFSLLPDDSRFSATATTVKRLRALAHKGAARVAPPECLTQSHGFSDPSLAHFAAQALKNNPLPFPGANTGVECVALENEFDEADFAAAKLCALAREKGFHFEEMAVLVRDLPSYAPLLEAAFDRYGIPFYMDRVESVATMPLIRLIQHTLGAIATGFRRTELLSLLKCGLFGVTLEEIAAFESYAYVWDIDKERFFTPFTQNPAGYVSREQTPREAAELARAEAVRKTLAQMLPALRHEAEEGSWPRALYAFLTRMDLPARTAEQVLLLKKSGRQKDGDDLARTWEALMELLDTMETVLAGKTLSAREFRDLFSASAAGYTLGRIPQTLDSVQVGSADRARVADKKAVLLLGVNERTFPLIPASEGLFTDKERLELAVLGLELSGNQEDRILEERFIAWQALSCPAQSLVLTYALGDIAGKPKYPSALVTSFRAVFPRTPVTMPADLPPEFFCRTPRTAFLQYVRHCTDKSVFSVTARAFLMEEGYGEKLARLDETLARSRFCMEDETLARRLFGGELRISPTQIEKYYTCRFQYFCRYGLKLRARIKAELNPLSRGSVLHFLLEQVLAGGDFLALTDAQLRALLEKLLRDYLANAMGGEAEKSRRFLYYYRKLATSAFRVFQALRAELSQTDFTVIGLEEPVGEDGKIPPLVIPVDNTTTVTIVGKIDRIDLYEDEHGRYVRVVDYKSGSKEFSLDAMAEGLNLQMLLYLFSLWKNGRAEYENVIPAGVLYMPAGTLKPTLPRDASADAQKRAMEEGFAMNGLLLDDRTVLCAMEKDLSGRFLPVSLGKSGVKGKYLASLTDFENLERYTEGLIRSMADHLFSGEISPDPISEGQFLPCNFCDYRAVCGHEIRDGFRSVHKITLDEIAGACQAQTTLPE